MRRRRSTVILALLMTGLLLTGPHVADRLNRERENPGMKGLRVTDLDSLGAASVLLLGGFRGIAIDVLWLRIIYTHQQREYAVERSLIELLLKLQPDNVGVWVFQAWNIAYNISVQFPDPGEQWKWIKDGITFLCRGIELNPDSGDLLFSMGWIYRNKIPQNPYFVWALNNEEGANNYEEGARWFERARDAKQPVTSFSQRVVDSEVLQCYFERALQILTWAELDENLDFPKKAFDEAAPFIAKARFEFYGDEGTPGLVDRHRDAKGRPDAGLASYGPRIDLIGAEAWIRHIHRTLIEGRFTEAAHVRAEKILDKFLSEMAKYRPTYWDTSNQWVLRNKYEDAWLAIPAEAQEAFLRCMNRGDLRDAGRLLELGEGCLEKAEAGLRAVGIEESVQLLRLRNEFRLRRRQFDMVTGG